MKIKAAFVYVVKQKSGLRKIGFSTNPQQRYEQIKSLNPGVKIERVYLGSRKDERHIHRIFSKYRVSREWFNLGIEHLLDIDLYFTRKYVLNGPEKYLQAYSEFIAGIVAREKIPNRREKEFNSVKALFDMKIPQYPVTELENKNLTQAEIDRINNIGISLKTAAKVKHIWGSNIDLKVRDICAVTGLSMSTVGKILAQIRKEEHQIKTA